MGMWNRVNRNGVCDDPCHESKQTPTSVTAKPLQSVPSAANQWVTAWVRECAELCQPAQVVWCDGSPSEREGMVKRAVAEGVLIELNQQKLPNCYLHRSNPNDVAEPSSAPLSARRGRTWRGHQQLDGTSGGLREAQRALPRVHGRADDVRHPVCDGADRLAPFAGGGAVDRLDICRDLDGDHDANGRCGLAANG